jgi:hypothetical protein
LLAYTSALGHCAATISEASRFTPRWVQSALTVNGTVPASTELWFGYWGHTGTLRFDYGAPLLQTYDVEIDYASLGEYRSLYDMSFDYGFDDISYCEDMYSGSYHEPNVYPGARYDLKVSMYLTVPAAYTRTVTQGVSLTDSRKQTGGYKRSATQTVRGTAAAQGLAGLYRSIVQTVTSAVSLNGPLALARRLAEAAAALYGTRAGAGFTRGITTTVSTSSVTGGMLSFFRTLFGIAGAGTAQTGLLPA